MKQTTNSPHGTNKMVRTPGAGIGAALLLGAALATAALASASALRRKRRSSAQESSLEINNKSDDNILRQEEVELENESTIMILDQSFKLDGKAKVDTDGKSDGFIIVEEEIPLLGEKFKVELIKEEVSGDHWKEWQEQEDNGVEVEVGIGKTKEPEGLCYVNGETNEEKRAEKTSVHLLASQQDNLVDEEEDGAEMDGEDEDNMVEEQEGKEKWIGGEVRLKGAEEGKENVEGRGKGGAWEVKVMKYEVGGKMRDERENGMTEEDEDSSRRRRRVMQMIWMLVGVLLLLRVSSSHLSFAKLALFLFLTLFLLEIYGY